MLRRKIYLIIIAILLSFAVFFAFDTFRRSEWILDKSHGKLRFTAIHLVSSEVDGWFKRFDAKIITEGKDFADAVATMSAHTASIYTDNDKRDADIKGSGFFDVEKYPTLTFVSKPFVKLDKKNYKVIGDMTIRGITKTIELNAYCRMTASLKHDQPIAGFKITGVINRLDFGIGTSTPLATIGNEITITANVEFVRKPLP